MSDRDVLNWVGNCCRIPSFIEEGGERGCCRKIAGWSPWIGGDSGETESRVFLAHGGGFSCDKAVIFGYFEIAGADVVMPPRMLARYRSVCRRTGYAGGSDELPSAIEEFWRREFPRVGFAVPGQEPVEDEAPEETDEELAEALVEALAGEPCPLPIPGMTLSAIASSLERGRCCGLRPVGPVKPREKRLELDLWWDAKPGLYFVDALTLEIDRLFHRYLGATVEELLGDGVPTPASLRALHEELLQRVAGKAPSGERFPGIEEFDRAVREAAARLESATEIPTALKPYVETRGCLVVFKKPFPTFRRLPRAPFQNYQRIDGDELLGQIADYYAGQGPRKIQIPYHVEVAADGQLTRQGLLSLMARRTDLNTSLARHVLDELAGIVGEELAGDSQVHDGSHPVAIRHLGKFRLSRVKARTIKNPQTGKPLRVPPGHRVHFRPSGELKERVR